MSFDQLFPRRKEHAARVSLSGRKAWREEGKEGNGGGNERVLDDRRVAHRKTRQLVIPDSRTCFHPIKITCKVVSPSSYAKRDPLAPEPPDELAGEEGRRTVRVTFSYRTGSDCHTDHITRAGGWDGLASWLVGTG